MQSGKHHKKDTQLYVRPKSGMLYTVEYCLPLKRSGVVTHVITTRETDEKTSHIHTLGLFVFVVVLWLETGSCCLAGLEPAM